MVDVAKARLFGQNIGTPSTDFPGCWRTLFRTRTDGHCLTGG